MSKREYKGVAMGSGRERECGTISRTSFRHHCLGVGVEFASLTVAFITAPLRSEQAWKRTLRIDDETDSIILLVKNDSPERLSQ